MQLQTFHRSAPAPRRPGLTQDTAPVRRVLSDLLAGLAKFPDPRPWGWVLVLLAFVFAFRAVLTGSDSTETAVKHSALLCFALAMFCTEPKFRWPYRLARPLAASMLALGLALAVFWMVSLPIQPAFDFAALSFAFIVTLREVNRVFWIRQSP